MSNLTISLYDSSFPVVKAALDALTTLLTKGQKTHPQPSTLHQARLCHDMSPLSSQVQYVCDIVHNLVRRTTGHRDVALSVGNDDDDGDVTLDAMHARVTAARALLDGADKEVVNGRANETFTLVTNTYGTVHLCVHAWVSTHIMPYLFFYLVTAYGILRKEGVPLRLMDYMGPFNHILKTAPAAAG